MNKDQDYDIKITGEIETCDFSDVEEIILMTIELFILICILLVFSSINIDIISLIKPAIILGGFMKYCKIL